MLEIDITESKELQERFHCAHEPSILVRRIVNGGRETVCYQCQRCGVQVGSAVKKNGTDTSALPAWSEELPKKWRDTERESWNAYRERCKLRYEVQKIESNIEWWTRYNAYLKTPQWAALRRRVIARDGFQCQACGKRIGETDAHVHHLSYATFNLVGWSLPAECQALCRDCHNIITNTAEQRREAA